ncbi:MAG: M48 family metalloprotease [Planctomycetota bacterium]
MKYALAILAGIVLFAALFPRTARKLFRKLGRSARDVGRAAQEIATGEELEGSPLARYEAKAGELIAARLLSRFPPSGDAPLQALVREAGERLATCAARREIPYRFAVVEAEEANAFAVPGGAVFVTRSLVALVEGDRDRVAAALAHEVAHIDRRHALRALAARAALKGLRLATLGRSAILERVSLGLEELVLKGYGREQELEADLFGVRIARAAGFDPRGLLGLLSALERLRPPPSGPAGEILGYLGTHPSPEARRRAAEREIARLLSLPPGDLTSGS